MTDNSAPYRPSGYTALTPYIVVYPAAEAIAFYVDVFGATVVYRLDGPAREGGLPFVGQAELDFGSGRLQLSDPMPAMGLVAPTTEGDGPNGPNGTPGFTGSTAIYVEDVDTVFAAAIAAGATSNSEPSEFMSGDRFASIVDPFGHRWSLLSRRPDISEEQSIRAIEAWWAEEAVRMSPDL